MNAEKIPSELVMRYRRATGLPVMAAKRALQACDADRRIALIVAAENDPGPPGLVRDPQEDDEAIGPTIRAVLHAVAERVIREHDERLAEMRTTSPDVADMLSSRRGICHLIWWEAKKALHDKHGIDWRTPAELNPRIVFD